MEHTTGIRLLAMLTALLTCLTVSAAAEVFFTQPPAEWDSQDTLAWTIFDVNEGDAMLLECGGESMLVDGGPNPFRESLQDALDARGLRHSTKYILSTHHHDDHIDGIYRLFEYGFTTGEYLHSYNDWAIRNEKRLSRTIRQAQANGVTVRRVLGGDTLTLGDADIQIFQCTEISGTNARSLVLKITFGQSALLLCADITGQAQHYFLQSLPEGALNADLIKLPHHAITPAVPAFLDAVSPAAAMATNRRKDLDNKSLNQLKHRELTTFFSGDGTVYAVTNGTDWHLWQTPGEF